MEDFRIVLVSLGALLILGVLVQGFLSLRKQQAPRLKDQPVADMFLDQAERQQDSLDDDVGPVRIRKAEPEPQPVKQQSSKPRREPKLELDLDLEAAPEPEASSLEVVESPQVQVKEAPVLEASVQEKPVTDTPPAPPQAVLVLNVVAREGRSIEGRSLLAALESLELHFGEMAIFHRHQGPGKTDGARLFSLVNMLKPGTFDLDDIDNFQTPGVSLFMALPSEVDEPMNAFEIMLDCARSLADEFDGQVLDEQRSVLSRQTVEHYRSQIREFERQQLLNAV